MASKPFVELTLAANEKPLTEAFERVGKSAGEMADKVDKSSDEMANAGKGFDSLAESTDTAETRSQGFADVIGGVTEGLSAWNDESLSTSERLQALAMAGADLAGGLTNFLVPAMASVAGFMKGGLASAMNFVSSHPLLITLGLLAAAFVVLWTQSETFRNIVTGVFKAVGGFITDVVGGAFRWVIDRGAELIHWFSRVPQMIGDALSGLGRAIGDAFKFALNVGIDALNWFIRRANDLVDGINWVTRQVGIPGIPHIPEIPRLHTGGIVPGMPGQEVPIIAMGGERITANGQGGGTGGTVRLAVAPGAESAFANLLDAMIADAMVTAVQT